MGNTIQELRSLKTREERLQYLEALLSKTNNNSEQAVIIGLIQRITHNYKGEF